MSDKSIILDNNYQEMCQIVADLSEKPFRAKQVYEGLVLGKNISSIQTVPTALRQKLLEKYHDNSISIIERKQSKLDETEKFLFKLSDGNLIEGVLLKYKHGYSQCVSTQVGCRMGCVFCASTLGGLVRNLTAGEILAQVLLVNSLLGGTLKQRKVTNIVLMGSGEPLDNYQNVVKFLQLITSENGLNMSGRNISLSTCGIASKIYDLADLHMGINLTISLHSPFDDERKKIMPIANAYSIAEILKGCDYYFEKTGRRYIFEYCLIKNKTDSEKCLLGLVNLLKGKPCHVNLIRLNEVKGKNLMGITQKEALKFAEDLEKHNISATVRRQIGADIDGACGQLRVNHIENLKNQSKNI